MEPADPGLLRPDLPTASIDPVRAAELGFAPAYMDMATTRIYLSFDASGRPLLHHSLAGLPPALVWARSIYGDPLVVKPTLRAGYVRGGFFYTVSSTSRALREWDVEADVR